MTYTLTDLAPEEMNLIAEGLSELPFKRSAALLQKLTEQAKRQTEAQVQAKGNGGDPCAPHADAVE